MKLFASLTVRLLLVLFVILSIAAYFLYRQTIGIMRENILDRAIAYHEEVVSTESAKLSLYVNEMALQTLALAHSAELLKMLKAPARADAVAAAEERLQGFFAADPTAVALAVLGPDLKVALGLPGGVGQLEAPGESVAALNRGFGPSNPEAKVPVYVEMINDSDSDIESILRYSVPISDENNALLGILMLDLNWSQLIQSLSLDDDGFGFFILNREGRLLAVHNGGLKHLGSRNGPAIRAYLSHDELIQLTANRKGNFVAGMLPDYLIVYSQLKLQGQTNLNATLGQIVPLSVIFAPINYARRTVEYINYVVLALVMLGLAYYSFYLLRPITRLAEYMRRYQPDSSALTRHEFKLSTRRQDEVGDLYAAFAEMSDALNRSFIEIKNKLQSLEVKNRELESVTEEARQLAQAKGDFLAIMSHEIRTPINAIVGFSHLLNEGDPDDVQDRAHSISRIILNSEHLLFLVDNILDLTRIQSGRLNLVEKEFRLDELIPLIVEEVASDIQNERVHFNCHLDQSLNQTLLGDPARLRQIFENLLNNAVKFTQEGEINLEVRVGVLAQPEQDREIIFVCEDTGIGIPQESLDDVFNAFEQIDTSFRRKYQGSGLGLAICKRLCELMNGSIELESTLGQGSRFTVRIPLKHVEDPHVDGLSKAIHERIGSFELAYRFLIVEDEPSNVEVLERYLKRIGAKKVDCAYNYESTLKALANESYDLIFMDLHLGGVGGLDIIRSIRNKECELGDNHQSIPIIVTTAYATSEAKAESLQAGANGYFTKPLNYHEVLAKVAELLADKVAR